MAGRARSGLLVPGLVTLALVASCGPGISASPHTNWLTYHSDKWGYSIAYPNSWHILPNQGAPDTELYVGNEGNIGAPLEMDKTAVLFEVSAQSGSCQATPADKVDSTAQLTVDGKAVKRKSGFFGGSASEAFWGSQAAVPAGTGCFGFSVIFGSKSARDANLGTTDRMIASFKTS